MLKSLYNLRDKYFLEWASVYIDNEYICIEWDLNIHAGRDGKSRHYIINPTKNRKLEIHSWTFTILLRYSKNNHLLFPEVFEIWDIIKRDSTFHIWVDGKICLFNVLYAKRNFDGDFNNFMLKSVIPYFYDVMYFKQHGSRPRWEYAHYELWIFQYIWEEERENLTTDEVIDICKSINNSSHRIDYIKYLEEWIMHINLKKYIENSIASKEILKWLAIFKNNFPFYTIKALFK